MEYRNEMLAVCDSDEYDSEHMLQITSKARTLADKCGWRVSVLCVGEKKLASYENLFQYGAHSAIVCEIGGSLEMNGFSELVESVIIKHKPRVLLFPASDFGKAVSVAVSVRFEAGLATDCIDFELSDSGGFLFSRAVASSSVIEKLCCVNGNMIICTMKKDAFQKERFSGKNLEKNSGKNSGKNLEKNSEQSSGTIEQFLFEPLQPKRDLYEVIGRRELDIPKESVDIRQYKTIFCIGRGVRSTRLKDRIICLAERCGAGIAGTRASVEDNMIMKERQIGQSGKSVSPLIYVGFGVSGASQHMAGIRNAETVIAINKDENAAIFQHADYIIVDDVECVVEGMEHALEA